MMKEPRDQSEIQLMDSDLIRLEREFAASVDRVFRAWSDPSDLQRWAWGDLGVDVKATVDFRVGGGFLISTARSDGSRWAFSGTYTELQPNRRLAHTLRWDAPMGYTSDDERVVVEFLDRDGRTIVVFQHEGVPSEAREGHIEGWANCFDALARVIEGKGP
jgi:uncharacterized protein YndB with AHSA1/START domain